MRRPRRQQEKCHVNLAEESIRKRRKSHGFALVRTLSCSRENMKEATKWHKEHKWFDLTPDGDAQCADIPASVERP